MEHILLDNFANYVAPDMTRYPVVTQIIQNPVKVKKDNTDCSSKPLVMDISDEKQFLENLVTHPYEQYKMVYNNVTYFFDCQDLQNTVDINKFRVVSFDSITKTAQIMFPFNTFMEVRYDYQNILSNDGSLVYFKLNNNLDNNTGYYCKINYLVNELVLLPNRTFEENEIYFDSVTNNLMIYKQDIWIDLKEFINYNMENAIVDNVMNNEKGNFLIYNINYSIWQELVFLAPKYLELGDKIFSIQVNDYGTDSKSADFYNDSYYKTDTNEIFVSRPPDWDLFYKLIMESLNLKLDNSYFLNCNFDLINDDGNIIGTIFDYNSLSYNDISKTVTLNLNDISKTIIPNYTDTDFPPIAIMPGTENDPIKTYYNPDLGSIYNCGELFYDTSNGCLYIYCSGEWILLNTKNIIWSYTEPKNVSIGDLWFDLNTGQLKYWDGEKWGLVDDKAIISWLIDNGNYDFIQIDFYPDKDLISIINLPMVSTSGITDFDIDLGTDFIEDVYINGKLICSIKNEEYPYGWQETNMGLHFNFPLNIGDRVTIVVSKVKATDCVLGKSINNQYIELYSPYKIEQVLFIKVDGQRYIFDKEPVIGNIVKQPSDLILNDCNIIYAKVRKSTEMLGYSTMFSLIPDGYTTTFNIDFNPNLSNLNAIFVIVNNTPVEVNPSKEIEDKLYCYYDFNNPYEIIFNKAPNKTDIINIDFFENNLCNVPNSFGVQKLTDYTANFYNEMDLSYMMLNSTPAPETSYDAIPLWQTMDNMSPNPYNPNMILGESQSGSAILTQNYTQGSSSQVQASNTYDRQKEYEFYLKNTAIVAGLIYGTYVAYDVLKAYRDNMDKICKPICGNSSGDSLDIFKSIGEVIVNFVKNFSAENISKNLQNLKNMIIKKAQEVADAVKEFAKKAAETVAKIVEDVKKTITKAIADVKSALSNLMNTVKSFINNVKNFFKKLNIGNLIGKVKDAVIKAYKDLKRVITDMLNKIYDGIKEAFASVQAFFKKLSSMKLKDLQNFLCDKNAISKAVENIGKVAKTIDSVVHNVQNLIDQKKNINPLKASNVVNDVKNKALEVASAVYKENNKMEKCKFDMCSAMNKVKNDPNAKLEDIAKASTNIEESGKQYLKSYENMVNIEKQKLIKYSDLGQVGDLMKNTVKTSLEREKEKSNVLKIMGKASKLKEDIMKTSIQNSLNHTSVLAKKSLTSAIKSSLIVI